VYVHYHPENASGVKPLRFYFLCYLYCMLFRLSLPSSLGDNILGAIDPARRTDVNWMEG
jgi:hypothetical protein